MTWEHISAPLTRVLRKTSCRSNHHDKPSMSRKTENVNMTAKPVVITVLLKEGVQERVDIFSTREKADAWADKFDADDGYACVFVPYVVDEPEFGNVPRRERQ